MTLSRVASCSAVKCGSRERVDDEAESMGKQNEDILITLLVCESEEATFAEMKTAFSELSQFAIQSDERCFRISSNFHGFSHNTLCKGTKQWRIKTANLLRSKFELKNDVQTLGVANSLFAQRPECVNFLIPFSIRNCLYVCLLAMKGSGAVEICSKSD